MAKPDFQYFAMNHLSVKQTSRTIKKPRSSQAHRVHPLHGRINRRFGLTLIEMMISVVLTLLVVLAIVRVFDMLGGTVSETRTVLELSAQLRQVSNQLQHDLDRLTAPPVPPADAGNAPGFFEIIEGPDRDKNPTWGMLHDLQVFNGEHLQKLDDGSLAMQTIYENGVSVQRPINVNGWYGDLDDVLMFTIASDGEPFKGRMFGLVNGTEPVPTIVESKYALVTWWVERYFDFDGIPKGFRLQRRQLLILQDPGIDETTNQIRNQMRDYLGTFNVLGPNFPYEINRFYNTSDVAVRIPTPAEQQVPLTNRLMMCTLEDLTERENRYGHLVSPADPTSNFPYPFLLPRFVEERCQVGQQNQYDTRIFWNYPSSHSKHQPPDLNSVSNVQFNGRQINLFAWQIDFSGEDVVLGDVLSFDVRVYDPKAPLRYEPDVQPANVTTGYSNSHLSARPYILHPTDRGYVVPGPVNNNLINRDRLMRGAFVDLFYTYNDPNIAALVNPSAPMFLDSPFAARTAIKSQMTTASRMQSLLFADVDAYTFMDNAAVYDTWSQTYNRDGIDQDDPIDGNLGPDQGNNGLDDDGNGVVDDEFEQEVLPPYATPLKGIEVIIRALEVSSEQVRQVSVVANFRGD